MVEELKKTNAWTFSFIGADETAVVTAQGFGISTSNAAQYVANSAGTRNVSRTVSASLKKRADDYKSAGNFRGAVSADAFLTDNQIQDDAEEEDRNTDDNTGS